MKLQTLRWPLFAVALLSEEKPRPLDITKCLVSPLKPEFWSCVQQLMWSRFWAFQESVWLQVSPLSRRNQVRSISLTVLFLYQC